MFYSMLAQMYYQFCIDWDSDSVFTRDIVNLEMFCENFIFTKLLSYKVSWK